MTTAETPDKFQDELKERAEKFAKGFANKSYERGEAQSFIIHLCQVFGLDSMHAVSLEHRVKKDSGTGMEFMDGFFPGLLLVEMKSSGKDLQKAYEQAERYVQKLKNPEEKPRYIIVCDFQNFHLYDLEKGDTVFTEFRLADLRNHVDTTLAFMLGYERIYQQTQENINSRVALVLSKLHDELKKARYPQKDMQTLLVRILFCLFGDDTEIFGETSPFSALVNSSNLNGEGLGDSINRMFTRLNTPEDGRLDKGTDFASLTKGEQSIFHFPYVNGALFSAHIEPANFTEETRKALLDCCNTDWSQISPDIFGTMFQNIMHWEDEAAGGKSGKRRDFGAHYTSERNIRRAIEPLFIDEIKENVLAAKALKKPADRKKALQDIYEKLPTLSIFDPACGCGNFLVVSYRELRRIELDLIGELFGKVKGLLDVSTMIKVNVSQFHGIEIDPTSAEIGTVALWLTDHQMNRQAAEIHGKTRPSIPLDKRANIVCGNALQTDWNDIIKAEQCSYIVGNPPFIGYSYQSKEQKNDLEIIFKKAKGTGVLDYVCAWYVKAWQHIQANPKIKCALVSTNSITQGEQVAILWKPLIDQGLHIHFAHRTFKWNNEGSGVAAVHCVIIGFGSEKPKKCTIWDYSDDIKSNGKKIRAKRINPYLADAPIVYLSKRSKPICDVIEMTRGSQPTDGGNLLLSDAEKDELIKNEPQAERWIRPFTMGDEFINNTSRWCLWLEKISAEELHSMPLVASRIEAVKQMRLASPKLPTKKLADNPTLFGEIRQPKTNYLALPTVSSERRQFIPIGFLDKKVICGNKIYFAENAKLYHFGILTSTMHNAWMRAVCGRMKSDYNYSNTIVYNNYPWATPTPEQTQAIETAAQTVLDARALHDDKSLAWLYNPETMPLNLKNAHDDLDDAVDEAYGYEKGNDDAERVAFLFELYQKLINTNAETTAKPIKAISKKAKATP